MVVKDIVVRKDIYEGTEYQKLVVIVEDGSKYPVFIPEIDDIAKQIEFAKLHYKNGISILEGKYGEYAMFVSYKEESVL